MAQEIMQNIKSMPESQQLYADVCHIIDDTRTRVAVYVNSEVCMTNWRIGTRIKEDVLYNKRAEYGKQVIKNLAAQLTERYGKGWSEKTLRHCLRAAETFCETDIVSAVRTQFTWTHFTIAGQANISRETTASNSYRTRALYREITNNIN